MVTDVVAECQRVEHGLLSNGCDQSFVFMIAFWACEHEDEYLWIFRGHKNAHRLDLS